MGYIIMKDRLLYIDYKMIGKDDIIEAFYSFGYDVTIIDYPVLYGENSEKTNELIENEICRGYSLVFTSNYYPSVSDICQKNKTKYISWTYDSPRISLYDISINNRCNYAFVFDSEECVSLRNKGVSRVYYMPLGVNTKRISLLDISSKDEGLFSSDVSLVASLYNENHNLYDRLYEKLDEYHRGYIDAVINAQKNVYGSVFLEESLRDDILKELYRVMPHGFGRNNLADDRYIYANYFLARKTATYQRKEFIRAISDRYQIKVYTPGDISDIPTAQFMGTVDYNTDMNKVFCCSKINLNVTLPSIKTGIPLRALDIMGAGGFLLTDYRADMEGLFEPGIDYDYYTSIDDALYKIAYYLEHEDERNQIAENGKRKVELELTYLARIRDILDIVNNE